MQNCSDCIFAKCFECVGQKGAENCKSFLTVESARYYATVRNRIFTALGDPVKFAQDVSESLHKAAEKNIELSGN